MADKDNASKCATRDHIADVITEAIKVLSSGGPTGGDKVDRYHFVNDIYATKVPGYSICESGANKDCEDNYRGFCMPAPGNCFDVPATLADIVRLGKV